MNIFQKIKEMRNKRHMYITQLSNTTGISRAEISLIENNKRNPTFVTMVYFANALNCSLEELFEIQN